MAATDRIEDLATDPFTTFVAKEPSVVVGDPCVFVLDRLSAKETPFLDGILIDDLVGHRGSILLAVQGRARRVIGDLLFDVPPKI